MTIEAPVTDLDAEFSSPGTTALPWTDAEEQLQKADVFGYPQSGLKGSRTSFR